MCQIPQPPWSHEAPLQPGSPLQASPWPIPTRPGVTVGAGVGVGVACDSVPALIRIIPVESCACALPTIKSPTVASDEASFFGVNIAFFPELSEWATCAA
jgi:hypothetical protein